MVHFLWYIYQMKPFVWIRVGCFHCCWCICFHNILIRLGNRTIKTNDRRIDSPGIYYQLFFRFIFSFLRQLSNFHSKVYAHSFSHGYRTYSYQSHISAQFLAATISPTLFLILVFPFLVEGLFLAKLFFLRLIQFPRGFSIAIVVLFSFLLILWFCEFVNWFDREYHV